MRRARGRLLVAALGLGWSIALAASIMWRAPILLVWNASASAPIGLYRLRGAMPARRGDMVVVRTPATIRWLAARRHYLPANVPMVKRVAAVAGERVCANGAALLIDGRMVATRFAADAAGRPMPWWNGCRRLRSGDYFLLGENRLSFDGRYFGVTRKEDVLGGAELLWAR
jgi:conjugative transfer signal peptidase TraF